MCIFVLYLLNRVEIDSNNYLFIKFWCTDKNGSGWWDSDMEGVDDGEMGFSEAWEGVGSSSLGGIIDWH